MVRQKTKERIKLAKNQLSNLPTRILGKSKLRTGVFSLGGQGTLETRGDFKSNIKIIERAFELGVNYFDTSPIYGPSEDYYGEGLKGIREKVYIASKSDDRTRDGSLKFLENSLKRLKTDYLDLWQIHHLENMKEVDQITEKDGALEAFIEMQEQGVVKHIGITGHEDPDVLLEIMKRHKFDTVLCPVNPADRYTKKPFLTSLIPAARKQGMGIIGMKIFAQGYVFNKKGITTKWEPLNFALSQDIDTIIVGCDNLEQLEENVALCSSFRKLKEEELKEVENKTKSYVKEAQFFKKEFGGYSSRDDLKPPLLKQ